MRPGPSAIHLGNVANNAYLNARMLVARGWRCHVVSNDYTHVMGCPEWEDADFDASGLDEFHPDWVSVDLQGFMRPEWFIGGSFNACASALRRRFDLAPDPVNVWSSRVWRRIASRVPLLRSMSGRRHPMFRAFPREEWNRVVGLTIAGRLFRSPLQVADLVVGYGTSGWIPRAAGVRYVALEHGTIRNLPFADSFEGRLCRDTYLSAAHVLVTNCDNDMSARRLGLDSWSFVPHPVNEVDPSKASSEALRRSICDRLGCDFLVLHPPRQHWDPGVRHPDWEKGNDLFIRGFADFVRRTGAKAGCVMVSWGQSLQASRELLAQLGVADRVAWIPVQPGIRLGEWMQAADLVADQFWLGAFGSLTPKAMRLSRPVLLNMDEQRHRWCFPELPPVLNSRTPGEVADHLAWCWRDRAAMRQCGERSADWYRRYHSNEVIAATFRQVHDMLVERDRRERVA
jgi:glycosyltransferase involved in cell wall biosynthesis